MMLEYRFPAWGLAGPAHAELRSNLLLIATELVTNAVDHTPDQFVRISCIPDMASRVIRFAVWDSHDGDPEAAMPDLDLDTLDLDPERFDHNGGWGLPLVQALSEDFQVIPARPGKWVSCVLKVDG